MIHMTGESIILTEIPTDNAYDIIVQAMRQGRFLHTNGATYVLIGELGLMLTVLPMERVVHLHDQQATTRYLANHTPYQPEHSVIQSTIDHQHHLRSYLSA